MSIEAMNWALKQKTGSPAQKSVLMILSNRADQNGRCWPGVDGIAEQTELSRRTVISNIQKLASNGFLCVEVRGGDGGGRKSNVYLLHIAGAKCSSCTGGQCAANSRQCAADDGQGAAPAPEPSDKPSKNRQIYIDEKKSGDAGLKELVPDDFQPTSQTIDYAAIHSLPDPMSVDTIEEFKLHYKAHPKLAEDWQAMYLKWLRNKRVFDAGGRGLGGRSKSKFEKAMEELDAC